MNASIHGETFEIAFDWVDGRARLAMVGSEGTEILILLPFEAAASATPEEIRAAVVNAGEKRLRGALMNLMVKGWPAEG